MSTGRLNCFKKLTRLFSRRNNADLTEFGSKMQRFFVRNALVARLVSEAAFKQYPQHVDVPIERPIFVVGLVCFYMGEIFVILGQIGEGKAAEFEFVRDEVDQRMRVERRRTRLDSLLSQLRSSRQVQVTLPAASATDTTQLLPHE